MKCPDCGSEDLHGSTNINLMLPLAARGGSVKVGGAKVTQVDLKNSWDLERDQPCDIKGPIICADCSCTCFYVSGAVANPYKISTLAELEEKLGSPVAERVWLAAIRHQLVSQLLTESDRDFLRSKLIEALEALE